MIDSWEPKDIVCRGRQKSKDRHEIDVFEHGSFLQCFSLDRTVVTDAFDAQTSFYFVVAIAASMSALRAEDCSAPVCDHYLQDLSAAGTRWQAIGYPMH